MAKVNEHGRVIAAAAKAALEPLGLTRKGRSRIWYADQRFWVISVEFQPSGWSKGSYLNVGIRWLWHAASGIDYWDRPVDFVPFESAEQFTPLIKDMAARAAQEVETWKDRFKTFAEIYRFLVANAKRDGDNAKESVSFVTCIVNRLKTVNARAATVACPLTTTGMAHRHARLIGIVAMPAKSADAGLRRSAVALATQEFVNGESFELRLDGSPSCLPLFGRKGRHSS